MFFSEALPKPCAEFCSTEARGLFHLSSRRYRNSNFCTYGMKLKHLLKCSIKCFLALHNFSVWWCTFRHQRVSRDTPCWRLHLFSMENLCYNAPTTRVSQLQAHFKEVQQESLWLLGFQLSMRCVSMATLLAKIPKCTFKENDIANFCLNIKEILTHKLGSVFYCLAIHNW